MKDWIWGRYDRNGRTSIPDGLPSRAFWFQKLAARYINYKQLPWEMGYPHYEELDNIFPFIIEQWKKRVKDHIEKEADEERALRGGR